MAVCKKPIIWSRSMARISSDATIQAHRKGSYDVCPGRVTQGSLLNATFARKFLTRL
jgi:hypothetical protein